MRVAGAADAPQPLSFRPGEAPKAAALPQWAPDQARVTSIQVSGWGRLNEGQSTWSGTEPLILPAHITLRSCTALSIDMELRVSSLCNQLCRLYVKRPLPVAVQPILRILY